MHLGGDTPSSSSSSNTARPASQARARASFGSLIRVRLLLTPFIGRTSLSPSIGSAHVALELFPFPLQGSPPSLALSSSSFSLALSSSPSFPTPLCPFISLLPPLFPFLSLIPPPNPVVAPLFLPFFVCCYVSSFISPLASPLDPALVRCNRTP